TFHPGERVHITMTLERVCLGRSCDAAFTCEHGQCVDPSTIGQKPDAGRPQGLDAGPLNGSDAGAPDRTGDVGPASRDSGATDIDAGAGTRDDVAPDAPPAKGVGIICGG